MSLLVATRRVMLSLGGVTYLLRDEFDDTVAAGSVNGLAATPGPGTRTVVDTDGDALSVGSGVLDFANPNSVWGDPGIWYDAFTRTAGYILLGKITPSATNTYHQMGWNQNTTAGVTGEGIYFFNDATLRVIDHTTAIVCGTYSATAYNIAVCLRAAGAYHFVKGGTFTSWTLLWAGSINSAATLYPNMPNYSGVFTADSIRIPDRLFIPPVALYDTFTAANGTSLDAHTSDSTGPDGGTQVCDLTPTWVEQNGDWDIQSNRANATGAAPADPVFIATLDAGISDAVIAITVNIGAAANAAGVIIRHSDNDNLWLAQIQDADNELHLYERNATTWTSRASTAVTINASTDYDIKAVADGQDITCYLDNANRITYGSAILNETATVHGVRADVAAAQFDGLKIWPRTDARFDTEFNLV